jgi:hypothetical protein
MSISTALLKMPVLEMIWLEWIYTTKVLFVELGRTRPTLRVTSFGLVILHKPASRFWWGETAVDRNY